jgi:hypothetical protein
MSLLGLFFLQYRRKDHLRYGRQNATASLCRECVGKQMKEKTDERKGLKFSVTG